MICTVAIQKMLLADGRDDDDDDDDDTRSDITPAELVSQNEWEGIEAALREATKKKRRRIINDDGARQVGAAIRSPEGGVPRYYKADAATEVAVEDVEDVAGPAPTRTRSSTRMAQHRRWGLKVRERERERIGERAK